jgi:hypothetical protein
MGIPPLIIINCMVPDYTPSMWGADDGPGYKCVRACVARMESAQRRTRSLVFFLEVTEETRAELSKPEVSTLAAALVVVQLRLVLRHPQTQNNAITLLRNFINADVRQLRACTTPLEHLILPPRAARVSAAEALQGHQPVAQRRRTGGQPLVCDEEGRGDVQ